MAGRKAWPRCMHPVKGSGMPCQRRLGHAMRPDGYYSHTAFAKNRESDADRYAKRVAAIHSLKVGRPCMDCGGIFHPVAMDFDHRPGETKSFGVSQVGRKWSKVLSEVAKCDLVCSNCHRIRTWVTRPAAGWTVWPAGRRDLPDREAVLN